MTEEIKRSHDGRKAETRELCTNKCCCPTVRIDHNLNKVVITDDYNGKIVLTKKQWRMLVSTKIGY